MRCFLISNIGVWGGAKKLRWKYGNLEIRFGTPLLFLRAVAGRNFEILTILEELKFYPLLLGWVGGFMMAFYHVGCLPSFGF